MSLWTIKPDNAVANGLSQDFSEGVLEGIINFTGGRTGNSFTTDMKNNFMATSITVGFLKSVDKKVVGLFVGGAIARETGYMTFGQFFKGGFKPAAHLGTRLQTLGHVSTGAVVNGARLTAAYEAGNFFGSFARIAVNRTAIWLSE